MKSVERGSTMEKNNIIKLAAVLVGVVLLFVMIGLYLSRGQDAGEKSRAELLDEESLDKDDGKQVFLIPKDDIHRFSITDANGIVLEFEHENNHWIYLDDKTISVDEDRIDKILNYLCDVRCISTLADSDGEKYGLNQDSIEYRVTDSSGSTIIISLGNYDEEQKELYFSINYDFTTIYINSGRLSNVSQYMASDLIVPESDSAP